MEFDKNSLLKLGKLSKIKIDDDKLSSLSKDLGSILNFIDRLQSLDTEEVDPTSNSLDQSLVMRDDIAIDKNSANEILENAPEKELDFFSVPKVIE
ncbi:MAG: Asp-tRNA(Asn)/Glu-tRNA(Gln) amidotransferase GatCAB subunit C [Pelagibacteraceae bacterium]|nr:Asp-tRNA(Asn)/Glu-tRNA(Gln) amidotransferase GatCAB subunit C [Pelagibacteraceae bacterium]|tara:strand:+ start:264 stop:551 length:288 start_codon:yes stop_codon:yes gene_type:complete